VKIIHKLGHLSTYLTDESAFFCSFFLFTFVGTSSTAAVKVSTTGLAFVAWGSCRNATVKSITSTGFCSSMSDKFVCDHERVEFKIMVG